MSRTSKLAAAVFVLLTVVAWDSSAQQRLRRDPPRGNLPFTLESDDGVLTVQRAAIPITSPRTKNDFVVWWIHYPERTTYVYSQLVTNLDDLSLALLHMPKEFKVDLPRLMIPMPELAQLVYRNALNPGTPTPLAAGHA